MGKAITFAQQKGGSGKTTLLAHLAHAWLLQGKKVAVIDLDPQGSLTRWLALGGLPALTQVDSRDYRAGSDIRSAATTHDLVLIDCPGNASSLLDAALRVSDLVVVPCQPTAMDIWATEAVLAMARAEGTASAVVLNRIAPRGSAADNALTVLVQSGARVMSSRIGNRIAFANGLVRGSTALASPGSSAAAEIEALRRELETLLG